VEIEFRDVSKNYGSIAALRGVTFTIRSGELVFLIGASGAGKTTIFRLINGELRPGKGQVWVDDSAVHKARRRHLAAIRRRIGFVGEDCGLLANRTSLENVEFALRVSDLSLPASEVKSRALAALRNVGIAARAAALPRQVSTGQRQRIALARALVTRPVVLLADEPTAGLDARNAMRVVKLLQRAASHQTAVLIATHDVSLAASVRARVLSLDKGRLVGDYPSWTELCRLE
jgi:ABC-type ATPase involved in cell division